MHVEVGQVLQRKYLVDRLVGKGITGSVYEARDYAEDRRLAIRVIEIESDHARALAFSESDAVTAGHLGIAHLTAVFDVEPLPSGEPCLVSEFVDGETLRGRIGRLGCTSELGAIQLLDQLIRGLSAAHSAGVIHRDLTPRSIFIAPSETGAGDVVKLADFGLSRIDLAQSNPQSRALTPADIDSFQSLSPEQLSGLRDLDPRSNVYSLGVIAYEALTGRLPFEGNSISALALNILQLDPTPVEVLAPATSPLLARLVRKAMSRTPNARFRTMEEMFAAIAEIANVAGIALAPLEVSVPRVTPEKAAGIGSLQFAAGEVAVAHSESDPDAGASSGGAVGADAAHDVEFGESNAGGSSAETSLAPEEHDEQTPHLGIAPAGVTPSQVTQGTVVESSMQVPAETAAPTDQPQRARLVQPGAPLDSAPDGQPARLVRRIPSVRPAAASGPVSQPATATRAMASVRPAAARAALSEPAASSRAQSRPAVVVAPATDVAGTPSRSPSGSRKLLFLIIGLMGFVIVGLAFALFSGGSDAKSGSAPEATPSTAVVATTAVPIPVPAPAPTLAAGPSAKSEASVAAPLVAKPSHVATSSAVAPAPRAKTSQSARSPQASQKATVTAPAKKAGAQKGANKDPYNYR